MSPELLGALMLVLMLGAIFIGFPISFTLLLLALIFGWVGLGDRAFYIMVFQTIGLMKEEVLAAVPLFIFMGYLMEQGGLMERLFKGLPAPDGAGARIALRGRAHHRHHLRYRRRHGGGDGRAHGHHGRAHHDQGRLRHPDVGRRHHRRRYARASSSLRASCWS